MHIVYTVYWIHKSPAEVGKKARVLPEALSKKRSVLAGRRCLFLQAKTMEGKTMVVLSSRRDLKKIDAFWACGVGVSKTKQNGSWPEP